MAKFVEQILTAKQNKFLEALAATGNISEAARRVKTDRNVVYRWKDVDENFAAAWATAINVYIEKLEAEVDRRAFEGHDDPVFHEGKQVGKRKKYSDLLAIFRLKALKPDKYRERFEYTGEQTTRVFLGTSPDENKDGVSLGQEPDGKTGN